MKSQYFTSATSSITLMLGLLMLSTLIITGCSREIDIEDLIQNNRTELSILDKKLENKYEELAKENEKQGRIKTLVWDSKEVDNLQLQISYLEDAISSKQEKIAQLEAGVIEDDSSWPWLTIFAIGIPLLLIIGAAGTSNRGRKRGLGDISL